MKLLVILSVLFSLTSCMGQTNESKKLNEETSFKNMVDQDTLRRPDDAYQMNLGFDDSPVWNWVKFDKPLKIEGKNYDHIYGIKFWDEEGFLGTEYYEQNRESEIKEIKDFSNYIIKRYPGDKTFQLVGKNKDTLLLFNVLENIEFRRNFKGKEFKRIPSVQFNQNNEKVSGEDIEVNIELIGQYTFLVTTIDSNGIKKGKFKSDCNLEDRSIQCSYFDRESNRVYLIDKNCFLEKIQN